MQGVNYTRNPAVLHCNMAGEAVLLREDTGVYYGLDDVGASVWTALDTPQSVASLAEAIAREYTTTADACRPDIARLIDLLVDAQLVETVLSP